jgi:hypothetical protein
MGTLVSQFVRSSEILNGWAMTFGTLPRMTIVDSTRTSSAGPIAFYQSNRHSPLTSLGVVECVLDPIPPYRLFAPDVYGALRARESVRHRAIATLLSRLDSNIALFFVAIAIESQQAATAGRTSLDKVRLDGNRLGLFLILYKRTTSQSYQVFPAGDSVIFYSLWIRREPCQLLSSVYTDILCLDSRGFWNILVV